MAADPRAIIRRPVVTERTTQMMEQNKYTFAVDLKANKNEIKQAIEEIFGVSVLSVNTIRVRGKMKRMGVHQGRRPDWKKAIVTLAEGDRIPIFEGL